MRTLLLILVLLPGCSFVFMETLPPNHAPQQEPRCTTTHGWALWDTLIAGTNLAVGVGVFVQSERLLGDYNEDDPRDDDDIKDIKTQRNAALLVSGAAVALYGASAIYGVHQSAKCETARSEHDRIAAGAKHSR